MREFVKLTTEEAIRETLRQDPTLAGTILKAADNDTVHLHLTQKYEVPAKYARAVLADYVKEGAGDD